MAANAFDYIRAVNHLSDELLRSHGPLLSHKNIRQKQELIRVIKLDLDKLTHALIEVKDNTAAQVLGGFFRQSSIDPGAIHDRLTSNSLYHVGFEIHEPLDLVLFGINHWIERSRWAVGGNMRIKEYLRFPASQAFQTRVGALTEIMRIWLDVNGKTLMLELFDIQRPADQMLALAPRLTHRNFHGLFRQHDPDLDHHERLARLFGPDEIWHYALHVKRPSDVIALHETLQVLAAANPAYFLPYKAPVHNTHDGSFHTKVIRRSREPNSRLEVEFVTHYGH